MDETDGSGRGIFGDDMPLLPRVTPERRVTIYRALAGAHGDGVAAVSSDTLGQRTGIPEPVVVSVCEALEAAGMIRRTNNGGSNWPAWTVVLPVR